MTIDKLIAELRAEMATIDEVIAVLEPLVRFAQKRKPRRAATRRKIAPAPPKRRGRSQKRPPLRIVG